MPRTSLLAAVLGGALALTACGDDGGSEPDSAATTASESGVTVTGEYGSAPELTIPEEKPPEELVVETLSAGEGEEVASGDTMFAHYHGQTWKPRPPEPAGTEAATASPEPTGEPEPYVFDSSYERGQAAGFPIGTGEVIPGWDEGLVGQTVGSRVLLTVPADQGYGDSEGHQLQDDTLVFVVDILESVENKAGVSGEPVADLPDGLPKVSGEAGEQPTIEIPETAKPAETSDATLLVAGDGGELEDNLVVNVLQMSYSGGGPQYSSWAEGNVPVTLAPDALPGLAEALDGQQVGSRVLVRIAAADNVTEQAPKGDPLAIVLDVVGTF